MRAFVTGGTGFIGRRLVEHLLARGDEVTCYARPTPRADRLLDLPVRRVLGELHDQAALAEGLRDAEEVFHVAGVSYVRRSDEFYQANREGTRHLVEACARRATPPVLVMVSSLAAAGPTTAARPLVETDPPRPVSHYGKSKWGAEQVLQEHAGQVPITVVRPPIVFGPADPNSLQLFQAARVGIHLVPTWRSQRFSFVHVDDLSHALLQAARGGSRLAGPADPQRQGLYYVSAPEQPTYWEVGNLLADAMQHRRPWKIPTATPFCFLAAAVGELVIWCTGKPWVVNWDKMREATAGSWICSSARAAQELHFAVPTPLRERLRETALWYQEHGQL